jgi:hypothetical protein
MRRLLGLVLVSFFAALLLSEFALRWFSPQITLFPRYIRSAEYPIEFPPLAKIVEAQGTRWSLTYTTNAIGRRGLYTSPDSVGARCSVVLLGDSFTFGVGVSDEEVYSEVLRSELGSKYVVINGGMSGWGLDSEIKWFHQSGALFNAKFVVVQFTMNDPTDDVGLTRLENDAFVFHPYVDTKPAWQWFVSRSSLLQHSHLFVLARTAYDSWRAKRSAPAGPPGPEPEKHFESEQLRYAALLTRFAEQVSARRIVLLYVSVTHHDRATGEYLYDLQRFPIIGQTVHQLDQLGRLRFIDLPLVQMKDFAGSPEGHQWGPSHHRAVATRLADAINSQPCNE